jgi:hypothetical protein
MPIGGLAVYEAVPAALTSFNSISISVKAA